MEYVLNSLNAVSQTGPIQELGDALSRAVGAVTTLWQGLVTGNLLESLATMDPATVAAVAGALISFIVILIIGYYTLLTA